MTPSEAGTLRWLHERRRVDSLSVEVSPIDDLDRWRIDGDGALSHSTGAFYSVVGLAVDTPDRRGERSQPVIAQPETGILGLLAKAVNGRRWVLAQAKVEPGNVTGVQMSPTVQATPSNFNRVHGGSAVPYLEYFLSHDRHAVVHDSLQTEHGQWYLDKRNRNVLVETTDDVALHPGFRWIPIDDFHRLLDRDNLVGMSARSVLGSLATPPRPGTGRGRFSKAMTRSLTKARCPDEQASVLAWLDRRRRRRPFSTRVVPLASMAGWDRSPERIADPKGTLFDVIGATVTSSGREVSQWQQPMISPHGVALAGLLLTVDADDQVRALVRASILPGLRDSPQIGPTVQTDGAVSGDAGTARMLSAFGCLASTGTFYDTVHSEEGGRIFRGQTRYMVVMCSQAFDTEDPDHRWVDISSLIALAAGGDVVNVHTRTLIAAVLGLCLDSRSSGTTGWDRGPLTVDPVVHRL